MSLADYEERLDNLKKDILDEKYQKNKYCFISWIKWKQSINSTVLEPMLKQIKKFKKDQDMNIIKLVRLVYMTESSDFTDSSFREQYQALRSEMLEILYSYPYWPTDKKNRDKNISRIIFWSENHLFMHLSSGYLMQQLRARESGDKSFKFEENAECKYLLQYLDVHLHALFGKGVYEVLSHVYLPLTLSALLNLYDFAENETLKKKAEELVDRIVYLVMLCSDPLSGIATFTASSRAYGRCWKRNFNQNIHQLTRLLNRGVCPDDGRPSAITEFITTTKWRPKASAFEASTWSGFISREKWNHTLEDINVIYQDVLQNPDKVVLNDPNIDKNIGKMQNLAYYPSVERNVDEYTPLYWSAGLLPHPDLARKTYYYIGLRGLKWNLSLLYFPFFTSGMCERTLRSYRQFSTGQLYAGVELNVYKRAEAGLVLTSFNLFNPHASGFQQLPWMANLNGVPVWSQSGSSSAKIAGFNMMNVHNPAVQQEQGLLLVSYVVPTTLTTIQQFLFGSEVRFFWPVSLFEEYQMKPAGLASTDRDSPNPGETFWCIGRRNKVLAAVLCTQAITYDDKPAEDSNFEENKGDGSTTKTSIPRLVCRSKYHSWVLVVATTDDYPTVAAFIDSRLRKIVVVESGEFSSYTRTKYQVSVEDDGRRLEYSYPPAARGE